MPLYDDSLFRYILFQCLVDAGHLRVLGSVDNRLPPELRQILAELDPSLDTGTAGRGPIVCNDQNLFHNGHKVTTFCLLLLNYGAKICKFVC